MLTHKRKYNNKSIDEVKVSTYEIYDFLASARPAYMVVAHNHPGGSAMPSPNDQNATDFIENMVGNFKCKLIDSFIIGVDGILSLKQLAFVRTFHNIGGIVNYLADINNDEHKKNEE